MQKMKKNSEIEISCLEYGRFCPSNHSNRNYLSQGFQYQYCIYNMTLTKELNDCTMVCSIQCTAKCPK